MARNLYGMAQQSTDVYVFAESTIMLSIPSTLDVFLDQDVTLPCDARSMNDMDLYSTFLVFFLKCI